MHRSQAAAIAVFSFVAGMIAGIYGMEWAQWREIQTGLENWR